MFILYYAYKLSELVRYPSPPPIKVTLTHFAELPARLESLAYRSNARRADDTCRVMLSIYFSIYRSLNEVF
jgi:hypothetical protein